MIVLVNNFGSMTLCVGISVYSRYAAKWLNLNNRGCLTHGSKNNRTSATKWLNYLEHCSAHFGADNMCVISSVGLLRQLTDIKISPFQGDEKRMLQNRDAFIFELPIPNVIEP